MGRWAGVCVRALGRGKVRAKSRMVWRETKREVMIVGVEAEQQSGANCGPRRILE